MFKWRGAAPRGKGATWGALRSTQTIGLMKTPTAKESPSHSRVVLRNTHTHMAAKSTVLERIILKVRSKAQQVSQNPSSAD